MVSGRSNHLAYRVRPKKLAKGDNPDAAYGKIYHAILKL